MEIQYVDRQTGQKNIEKVYGSKAVEWLYSTYSGRLFAGFLVKRFISHLYGKFQNTSLSKKKINVFCQNFNIDLTEFLPEDERSIEDPYENFNAFFIRRFRPGLRHFESDPSIMPAFCEARYYGHKSISGDVSFPVKGNFLSAKQLLADERWALQFQGGPILVARLCPVDYHRFHYPDEGKIIDQYRIPGLFHSVNPLALKKKGDIFITNERHITILDTKNFGKLAYIEVGATLVGKIVQTHPERVFSRGDEKGYFLFGGSTVIVLGQKNTWVPSDDILENSSQGLETYLHLGKPLAVKV